MSGIQCAGCLMNHSIRRWVLGLAGITFKTWQERTDHDLQSTHDLKIRELDQADMQLEADLLIKQREIGTEGKVQQANIEADTARDVMAG